MTHQGFVTALTHEFELAFLSTGLQPVRRNWGDGRNNGCMVTALDVGEHGAVRADTVLDEIKQPSERVQRVVAHLAARFPQFNQAWWKTFVRYCVLGYDGTATFPARWLQKTADATLSADASAKRFGAAVGGQVFQHVCAQPHEEIGVTPAASRETAKEFALV